MIHISHNLPGWRDCTEPLVSIMGSKIAHFSVVKLVVVLSSVILFELAVAGSVTGSVRADNGINARKTVSAGQIPGQLPNFGQEAKLEAEDAQTSDLFGDAIAVDGNTAVVGASGEAGGLGDPLWHAGAAYVFQRDWGGTGNWGQAAKLVAGDADVEDIFGSATAVSNNGLIFIGALDGDVDSDPPVMDSGVVYVFKIDFNVDYSLYLPVLIKPG